MQIHSSNPLWWWRIGTQIIWAVPLHTVFEKWRFPFDIFFILLSHPLFISSRPFCPVSISTIISLVSFPSNQLPRYIQLLAVPQISSTFMTLVPLLVPPILPHFTGLCAFFRLSPLLPTSCVTFSNILLPKLELEALSPATAIPLKFYWKCWPSLPWPSFLWVPNSNRSCAIYHGNFQYLAINAYWTNLNRKGKAKMPLCEG